MGAANGSLETLGKASLLGWISAGLFRFVVMKTVKVSSTLMYWVF